MSTRFPCDRSHQGGEGDRRHDRRPRCHREEARRGQASSPPSPASARRSPTSSSSIATTGRIKRLDELAAQVPSGAHPAAAVAGDRAQERAPVVAAGGRHRSCFAQEGNRVGEDRRSLPRQREAVDKLKAAIEQLAQGQGSHAAGRGPRPGRPGDRAGSKKRRKCSRSRPRGRCGAGGTRWGISTSW